VTQPPLFTDAIADTWPAEPPSVAGSSTSIAAAKAIEPVSGRLRKAVYEWIKGRGEQGGTDEEAMEALAGSLGVGVNTIRPRRIELVQAGYVRDSGRKRPTRSSGKRKCQAVVWVVTESGAAP
jgi:hypothetical protein